EAGADLDGEMVDARHIGRLDVDFSPVLGDVEPEDRRHRHRRRGQRAEGVLHAVDGVEVKRHERAQVCLGQDGDGVSHLAGSSSTRVNVSGATLAPERMQTVSRPGLTRPDRIAAWPTAAAPSTASPVTAWIWRMAAAISPSVTSTTSSRSARHIAKVTRLPSPIPPPRESASVGSPSTPTRRPAARLAAIAAPRAMLTPITRVAGDKALTAAATPEASPPPERGTNTADGAGQSARISSPSVPCPATTAAASKGGTSASPSSATARATSAIASSWLLPTIRTSAPRSRTA